MELWKVETATISILEILANIVEYPLKILWRKFNFLLLKFQEFPPLMTPHRVWYFVVSYWNARTGTLIGLFTHRYTFADSFQNTCPRKSPQVVQSSPLHNSQQRHGLCALSHASTYGEKCFLTPKLVNGYFISTRNVYDCNQFTSAS